MTPLKRCSFIGPQPDLLSLPLLLSVPLLLSTPALRSFPARLSPFFLRSSEFSVMNYTRDATKSIILLELSNDLKGTAQGQRKQLLLLKDRANMVLFYKRCDFKYLYGEELGKGARSWVIKARIWEKNYHFCFSACKRRVVFTKIAAVSFTSSAVVILPVEKRTVPMAYSSSTCMARKTGETFTEPE